MKKSVWVIGLVLFTGLVVAQDHRTRMFNLIDEEQQSTTVNTNALDLCAGKLAKFTANMKDANGLDHAELIFESVDAAKMMLIKWIQAGQLAISYSLCDAVDVQLMEKDVRLATEYRLPSGKRVLEEDTPIAPKKF